MVLEQTVGIRLGRHQAHPQIRQSGGGHRHGKTGATDGLKGDADRCQRARVEVVHLIDQKQRARPGRLSDLADLADQVGEILLGVAGVGQPGRGLDVELERHRAGHGDAERLDDTERTLDAFLHAMATAHLTQQPRRHPSEGHAEVWLGAHLLDVGGRPPRLGGQHIELHQQHGLAHAPQPRVDQAALVATGGQALGQRLEVLQVAVAAGEVGGLRPAPGV